MPLAGMLGKNKETRPTWRPAPAVKLILLFKLIPFSH